MAAFSRGSLHCLPEDSKGVTPTAAAFIVWCKTAMVCHPLLQFSLFAARPQGCATHCCSFHCLLQDRKGVPPTAAVFIVCCKTARVCHPLLQLSLFAARPQGCATHCCSFHCLLQDRKGVPPTAAVFIVCCKTARVCQSSAEEHPAVPSCLLTLQMTNVVTSKPQIVDLFTNTPQSTCIPGAFGAAVPIDR